MRHIPNILSSFRIVLIPFFVLKVIQGNMFAAALLLILSALTDMLDGFLARRFGWVTNVGKVLDPVADKLTQISVCVLFAIHLAEFWFLFAILALKELTIMLFSAYLVKNRVQLEGARWFGKLTTALFYTSMILIALFPALPVWVVYTLLISTIICAIGATLMYIPEFIQHKKRIKPEIELEIE
ncbi:MAG: CDP-alcohol phosphatidyltransferase family protein [Oscillospiraceae bacterium]|nr:CDP-alcohol phosphatidyltransferase family protein [Oscillospiraceae bacterium]